MPSTGASTVQGGRESNEDAFLVIQSKEGKRFLLAVFDGLGGMHGGGVASKTAAQALESGAEKILSASEGRESESLRESILRAHEKVLRTLHGIGGTTVVAALIKGNRAFVAHAGDSRAYLVRGGKAILITHDHASTRNLLTSALGFAWEPRIDSRAIALSKGDALVLCSDGLWEFVGEDDFAEKIVGTKDAVKAARALVGLAEKRACEDNATTVVYVHA